MTSNSQTPAIKPIYKKSLPGGIAAAVFEKSVDGGGYRRSVNLQQSYRKNEEWRRRSLYLDLQDIPLVIEALQGAWRFLVDSPHGAVESPPAVPE